MNSDMIIFYKDWENWTDSVAEQQVANYIKRSSLAYNLLNSYDGKNKYNDNNKFIEILADDITEYSTLHSILLFLNASKLITNYNSLDFKLKTYATTIDTNKILYKKILKYAKSNESNLHSDDALLLFKVLNKFSMNCDSEEIAKLLNRKQELEDYIEQSFTDNKTNITLLSEDELDGVDLEIIKMFERDLNEKKYIIHLSEDIYKIFMTSITKSTVRKKIELLYSMKCFDLIKEICELVTVRNKIAQLSNLNKVSKNAFSDSQNSDSMLCNFESIMKFITGCMDDSYEIFSDNIKILKDLKSSTITKRQNSIEFGTWDIDYYTSTYKQYLDVDDKNLNGCFKINHAIASTLSIIESLFSVKFVKKNLSNRLKNIAFYSVMKHNKVIGDIYLDLLDSNIKTKSESVRCYIIESPCFHFGKDKRILPCSVITASFNQDNFCYDDISSLFQNFGYALHNIFGFNKYYLFCGNNVPKDYMDLSSLLLEYICWDSKIIQIMANRDPRISPEIVNNMKIYKNFTNSIDFHRQLMSAIYDQLIYTNDFSKGFNVAGMSKKQNNSDEIDLVASKFIQFNEYIHEKLYKKILQNNEGSIMPYKLINNYDDAGQFYSYLYPKIVSSNLLHSTLRSGCNYQDLVQKIILPLYNNEQYDKNTVIKNLLNNKITSKSYFELIKSTPINEANDKAVKSRNKVNIKAKKISNNRNANVDTIESSDMYQTETTETLKRYANIFTKN
jgi:Zn-dependent oligopeptidase